MIPITWRAAASAAVVNLHLPHPGALIQNIVTCVAAEAYGGPFTLVLAGVALFALGIITGCSCCGCLVNGLAFRQHGLGGSST